MSDIDPGTSVHFRLRIDGIDLGDWNSCDGLGCEVEVEQHQEGGNNGFVWQLPSRVRYTNVTLTRPLIPDTAKVARMLAKLPQGVTRGTAQIAALRPDRALLVQWGLADVVLVRWTGPSFDPSRSETATESIELAYHGFLEVG
ncbi:MULTISPECIES: phage tail protein [unclassified Micromonospora]|uniref:phage tail protein n=1 Tax=unclassified Micromonospora TaxID=2617518 RepID=UPI0010345CB5|nr:MULTISPECIES: phage tail protein [unclassified Micromonospora]QKW12976.1 phage tail protein [Verrucosispora sp. NA02020]TBL30599.1 phage tail protein [Verrucosispora sp. SN26_14.1]